MATLATARSPSCGGREHDGVRQAAAAADTGYAALLGWLEGRDAAAAALRRVRQGAALSAAGVRCVLVDGLRVDRCERARARAQLDGDAPSVPSRMEAGAALRAANGGPGGRRSDAGAVARAG